MHNFVLQTPSLQHIVLVKIATHLWTLNDIFAQFAQSFDGFCVYLVMQETIKWKEIEEKVESKVSALKLPERNKKQILNLIKPLEKELVNWCYYHRVDDLIFQFLENKLLPQQLCWTVHGNIDYAKTAELMLKDERLDVERRYDLACINCLEDEARELFQSMGEERRQEYVKKARHARIISDPNYLIVYFTSILSGDVAHLDEFFQRVMLPSHTSFNTYLFKVMLPSGNRATCEYLFNTLNHQEKDQVLAECRMRNLSHRHSSSNGCVLYYLSLMNEAQQERVFRTDGLELLQCLLRWPQQSLFVTVAECGWQFMDNDARTKVLRALIFKISHDLPDYDYRQLFWECWRLTSAEYNKQHFLCTDRFLSDLLLTKQVEFIQLVFNEGDSLFIKNAVNYDDYCKVLMDESVISDAELMESKQTAALKCSKDPRDMEKRLRSHRVGQLVDIVMERRLSRRRL